MFDLVIDYYSWVELLSLILVVFGWIKGWIIMDFVLIFVDIVFGSFGEVMVVLCVWIDENGFG